MFTTARVLFLAFFNICLFKKRPQDFPESAGLMWLTVFSYVLVATSLLATTEALSRSLLSAMLEIGLLFLFTLGLLQLTGKIGRWIQTMTALSGTSLVLSLIALPIYLLMSLYSGQQTDNDPLYSFVLLILAGLAVWNIAVMAHILRNALEVGTFTSVMLAISYIWIILSVSASVFPTEFS